MLRAEILGHVLPEFILVGVDAILEERLQHVLAVGDAIAREIVRHARVDDAAVLEHVDDVVYCHGSERE